MTATDAGPAYGGLKGATPGEPIRFLDPRTYVPHDFPEQSVDLGEVTMNYAVAGSPAAPALLLIPGQTESWWGYEKAMALLAEHFQVYAVDVRGHGRSSWTPGRYTLDNMGDDLVRFIATVIKRPVITSGCSSGGLLSAWLSAYALPGQLRGAVLEDPPLFSSETNPLVGQSIKQAIGDMFRLNATYLGDQWRIGDWDGRRRAASVDPSPLLRMIPTPAEPPQNLKEYDPEFGRAFWEGTVARTCPHDVLLTQLKTPVLLTHHARQIIPDTGHLFGAMSDLQAEKAQALITQSGAPLRYESLADAAHAMHTAQPQRFADLVTDWAASLPAEPPPEPAMTKAKPGCPCGRIDVHAHFLPDFYVEALARAGLRAVDGGMPIPAWSAAAALEVMDRQDIATAMISLSSPSTHFLAPAQRSSLVRQVNLAGRDLMAAHPGRFGFFATLPLPDVAAALDEIAYAFDTLGVDGVILESNVDGEYLGSPRFAPVFAELDRRRAVVFLHPTSPTCLDALGLGRPAPLLEFPLDTTRTVVDLIYNRTLQTHPNIRLIVPHGGAALPALCARIAAFANLPFITPRPVSEQEVFEALQGLYYDLALSAHPLPFAALRALAPLRQILFGSDWPFTPEIGVARNLHALAVDNALTDADLQAIARDNAERLFPRLAALRGV